MKILKLLTMAAVVLVFAGTGNVWAKVVKRYYPDGTVQAVVGYNGKNQMHGVYKYYWPNGRLKEVGRNKNGIRIGQVKRYTMDGVLQVR